MPDDVVCPTCGRMKPANAISCPHCVLEKVTWADSPPFGYGYIANLCINLVFWLTVLGLVFHIVFAAWFGFTKNLWTPAFILPFTIPLTIGHLAIIIRARDYGREKRQRMLEGETEAEKT